MSDSTNKAELNTALKIGLACGISVAAIELYYLLVGLFVRETSQPIYQTLWLLTAFIFAMAGVWAVRFASRSLTSLRDVVLYSGVAGAITGIFYAVSSGIVELVYLVIDNIRYFDVGYFSYFITNLLGIVFSSLLWLPVVIAVSVFGGLVYATLAVKAGGNKDTTLEEKPLLAIK